ncbi:MAG: SAM-dependent chlorinase/fluorinase [Candidatus Eisenbacteria bacterium]
MRPRLILLALLLGLGRSQTVHARPIVGLLTDFGLDNEAVGLCHGAILAKSSDIEVVDVCNAVTPYDVELAGIMLRGTKVFPAGSAIVAVVDPGVGTARRPVAIKTNAGLVYVGPDNGIFSWVIHDQGLAAAVELEPAKVNPAWQPGTFDGRDLFSPAAATLVLASGDLTRAGRAIDAASLVRIATGEVMHVRGSGEGERVIGQFLREDKPYGNLWTNIGASDLESLDISLGDSVEVHLTSLDAKQEPVTLVVPFVRTFGDVAEGAPLAYVASGGTLAFALNQGSFLERYPVEKGAAIAIRKKAPR